MSEEQRRRWQEWGRTGQALFHARLLEGTIGPEAARVAQAEQAHHVACEAISQSLFASATDD